ncbi:MAG: hypothetical protein Kow0022_01710 [Phycisphaerales bacterium]
MDQLAREGSHKPGAEMLRAGIESMNLDRPAEVMAREEPTPRIALRALTEQDRAEFVELVNVSLPHLSPWIPGLARGQSSEEFFELELERTLSEEPKRRSFRRVGVVDGRIIGMFNLFNISIGLTMQSDISWWVARPYTRRGYAGQAIRLLMRHAFTELPEGLGLHRVMAMIAPENVASLRLARSLGFVRHVREDHYIQIGQTWKKHECWMADAMQASLTEIKTPRGSESRSLRSQGE